MSGSKEKLEYELQKLHQEKVETELEEISQELSNYYRRQERTHTKKRRENIYVLFAIAIIGAFFSLIPRSSISVDRQFLIGFGVFALTSLVFLIIKINTVALSDSFSKSNRVDNFSEYLFAFSINGILILISAIAVVSIFDIQVSQIMSGSISLITGITSLLMVLLWRYQKQQARREMIMNQIKENSKEHRQELLEEIKSQFKKLRSAETRKEKLIQFNELVSKIELAKSEFINKESIEEMSEEMDDIDNISDDMYDILQEEFEKAKEALQDDESEDENVEEQRERLRKEYEEILSETE